MSSARGQRTPLVLVTGGKGGVGKSTLVANLGLHLAKRGLRTLLVDLDLALANLHVLFGVSPRHTLEDFFAGRPLASCVVDLPGGLSLVPAANGAAELCKSDRGPREELLLAAAELARDYDIVLGDSAAGIGPDVLHFARRADRVLVVTTPEPAALTDAYGFVKAVDVAEAGEREVPTPELFLNKVAGADQAGRLASRLGGVCERFLTRSPRLAGWMSRSHSVRRSAQSQRPFALRSPDSLENRCLDALSRQLERGLPTPTARIAASSSF